MGIKQDRDAMKLLRVLAVRSSARGTPVVSSGFEPGILVDLIYGEVVWTFPDDYPIEGDRPTAKQLLEEPWRPFAFAIQHGWRYRARFFAALERLENVGYVYWPVPSAFQRDYVAITTAGRIFLEETPADEGTQERMDDLARVADALEGMHGSVGELLLVSQGVRQDMAKIGTAAEAVENDRRWAAFRLGLEIVGALALVAAAVAAIYALLF